MRTIDKIIIHCTDTPKGRDVSVSEIKRWHVVERGWSDIGYHFVIGLDGVVHTGRPIHRAGAHTKGYNSESVGVAYVGGANGEDTRTESQKKALLNLVTTLNFTYPLTKGQVYGHRDFSPKECPSFDAKKEYN
jgi:N-acetylmuramoyl-L-alanine amidase